ncbi:MAG: hypothetical protein IPI31_12495 [Bacteroidetes bacterium]|nr:hypothetical protein [Bacteroidota bacterium]
MKTFISDLIPKLLLFSQKIDNLALLTNQHWVAVDDISENKNVYIFRTNNDLLISHNGKVEKAKWEYLGNNSLLIDKNDGSYLFKHGFFDENILALRVDSKDEYAFFINENKYGGELNSLDKVINFLTQQYLEPHLKKTFEDTTGIVLKSKQELDANSKIIIKRGEIEIEVQLYNNLYSIEAGLRVFINSKNAPNGKYKIGFMEYIYVVDGIISKTTIF